MKIAVDIPGGQASRMLARQGVVPSEIHVRQTGSATIAATAGVLCGTTGQNWLATIGTPIDPPESARIVDVAAAVTHLTQQDGAFASIFWSAAERKLVIVTDFLGFKPIYIRRLPGVLQLASTTKAWNDVDPDPAGWGAFVSFGHTIGDRTLLEGVRRVEPASILIYDFATDRLIEQCYWDWPKPDSTPDIAGIVPALSESVDKYAHHGEPGTILLSGGFDSRLIACLLGRAGIPAKALVVNHPDELLDADGRFAASFARRHGIPFQRVDSPVDFFSSQAYLDYLFDSDAATPSLSLFISQVSQFVRDEPVWEGVIPGCTLPTLHQPAGGFDAYLRQECRSADSQAWNDARTIFRADFADEMRERFDDVLRNELEMYSDCGYGVTQFVIRNRARNRTSINPLQVFESRQRAFLPGLTRRYFNLAGSLSFEVRRDNRLYLELLRRYFPEALACPIVSGGELVKLSKWSLSYHVNRLAGVAGRLAVSYPSIARRLRFDRTQETAPRAAQLLDPLDLIDSHDGYVDIERVRAFDRRGQLSAGARKLLFHWCAWRRLHKGRLNTILRFEY